MRSHLSEMQKIPNELERLDAGMMNSLAGMSRIRGLRHPLRAGNSGEK